MAEVQLPYHGETVLEKGGADITLNAIMLLFLLSCSCISHRLKRPIERASLRAREPDPADTPSL